MIYPQVHHMCHLTMNSTSSISVLTLQTTYAYIHHRMGSPSPSIKAVASKLRTITLLATLLQRYIAAIIVIVAVMSPTRQLRLSSPTLLLHAIQIIAVIIINFYELPLLSTIRCNIIISHTMIALSSSWGLSLSFSRTISWLPIRALHRMRARSSRAYRRESV